MQHKVNHLAADAHAHRQAKRRQIDELLVLAEYLPQADKILVEQVLTGETPIAQIAKLYQRPTRHLKRKAQSIIKRLSDKHFKFVAIQMDTLPLDVRDTAKLVVIQGISMRKVAQTTGMTLHRVRQNMNTVRATARLFV